VSLSEYEQRRDFAATPEPAPDAPVAAATRRFVIQEHHATSLHWDLRLEHEGILASWALPRGIPPDPRQNRLAVRTEDHPLAYLEFEGEIPKGQYGGGLMEIWDSGTYQVEKFRDREVIVVLHGERVTGRYALFRTEGRNWMIHRMDPPDDPGRELMPEGIAPMLAKPGSLPPHADDWAFEIKWDGVRLLAYVQGGRVELRGRSGLDMTATYPELRGVGAALGMVECVLDGEVVALDEGGVPRFERLQQRMNVTGDARIARLARSIPVRFHVFDLLFLDGRSAMSLPYRDRRRLLEALELDGPAWGTPASHVGTGREMLEFTREHGLEGVVAKRLDSRYEPGRRSDAWVKVKNARRLTLEIGGFTLGRDGRSGHIGAVVLGERLEDGSLRCAGKAGSGLTSAVIDELESVLVRRTSSPFDSGSVPVGTTFVEPEHRAVIEFTEWTAARTLRHPIFKALVRAGEDD
jgi:bifunctional non-homologous end joining protein LigD